MIKFNYLKGNYFLGDTEKKCTDIKYSRKHCGEKAAEKLHMIVEFFNAADSFHDIIMYTPFHFHELKGKMKGKFAIDIIGRNDPLRLKIVPVDENRKEKKRLTDNFYTECKLIRIVGILEVSNHYE